MPTRYHHGDLRAALLARAAEVVAADGVTALSLRELARDLGVSHGAPSRHFPDKQALLDALALNGFRQLHHDLAAAVASDAASEPFAHQLHRFAAAYVSFFLQNASLLEVMFAAKHRQEAPEELRAAVDRTFDAPLRAIERAQRRGELIDGDVEEIATTILATVHGFAALIVAGGLPSDEFAAVLVATTGRLVEGLRPRQTPATAAPPDPARR